MCDHHAGRRALLLAGAGLTTTAALAPAAGPASADQTSTVELSGTFTGVGTPDWHYLPFEVPAGVVTARVPAGLANLVRAEGRRLDGAVTVNPLEGVPALTMVAMTNPTLLGGA